MKKVIRKTLCGLMVLIVTIIVINQISVYPFIYRFKALMSHTKIQGNIGTYEEQIKNVNKYDVIYRQHSDDSESAIYLYAPSGESKKLPLIIFLHGGGWVTGSAKSVARYAKLLASNGYIVASIDYALAPEYQFPVSTKQIIDYMKDIIWFADHGYRVFAADYTAGGHSEGTHTGGLSRTPIDLDQVLIYIENDEELSKMDKVLYGHSWGAYGVTAILNYEHDIKAVVSLAAYNAPAQQIADILSRTLSPVLKVTEPFFWLNNVIDYGKYGNLTAVDGINKSNVPVLIVQGTGDQMISYEESSLVAFKDRITNPYIEYLIISEDGLNDYDSFFYTREGNAIIKAFNEKKGQLLQ